MSVDFDNIFQHVIPMEDFGRKWRFTEERYDILPDQHLEQLKPLDKESAKFLWNFIDKGNLHRDQPFQKGFFRIFDNISVVEDNEKEIKKWLYHRGLPFKKPVFLSWNQTDAMIIPWKLLIKYFDSFYYSSSDDFSVFDNSLNWALLFSHYDEIFFGTNKVFKTDETFADIDLI